MSFSIELELREALKVCNIPSGNWIGWTAAVWAVAVVGVVDSSAVVDGFGGVVLMLSNDGALSESERGLDSASRNLTNASAKLSLL